MTSVNANYYNATTKNGAPYRKTNANKKAGATIGALAATGVTAYGVNILRKTVTQGQPVSFFRAMLEYVKANPVNILKGVGAWALGGLAIGAIVDGIVNKVRRNKADKAFNTQA